MRTWRVAAPLAADRRPASDRKERDHGLVRAIETRHAYQQEADAARAPGRRADGAGRGQPGRDRAEDPSDRGRGPQRPEESRSVIPLTLLSRSPPGPIHLPCPLHWRPLARGGKALLNR